MKEPVGDLNNSVFVITSIAILAAFFYTVLWPMLDRNQEQQSACSKAICNNNVDDKGYVSCTYKDSHGATQTTTCKFKG